MNAVKCFVLFMSVIPCSHGLNNGLAAKPPMGWCSWNYYSRDLNESLFYDAVTLLTSSGMKDAGYEYINVDGGWWARNATNHSVIRNETDYIEYSTTKFPHGIRAMVDYIHDHGFKYGHYTDAGTESCGLKDSKMSQNYKYKDLLLFAIDYNIDMIKIDGCNVDGNMTTNIIEFSNILLNITNNERNNRSILFSDCHNGCVNDPKFDESYQWRSYCPDYFNMWRVSKDISPKWKSMLHNIGTCKYMGQHGKPHSWNDPDFLEVGNGEFSLDNISNITNITVYNRVLEMNRAHFSLWCIVSAPLLAGNRLYNMSNDILKILTNKMAIEINQNYQSNGGDIIEAFYNGSNSSVINGNYKYENKFLERLKMEKTNSSNMTEIWYKPLPKKIGNAALLFLNRNYWYNESVYNMSVDFIDLPINLKFCDWVNVWDHNDMGTHVTNYNAMVVSASVKFVKLMNCANT